jgi:hypothetical protein
MCESTGTVQQQQPQMMPQGSAQTAAAPAHNRVDGLAEVSHHMRERTWEPPQQRQMMPQGSAQTAAAPAHIKAFKVHGAVGRVWRVGCLEELKSRVSSSGR